METANSQQEQKILFSHLVQGSRPESFPTQAMEAMLQKYPYCQLLHGFYARALKETKSADFEAATGRAACYAPDRNLLYSLIYRPESLAVPAAEPDEVHTPEQEPIELPETTMPAEETVYAEIIEEEIYPEIPATEQEMDITPEKPETLQFSSENMDEDEKMIIGNIASADFFIFEEKMAPRQESEPMPAEAEQPESAVADDEDLSAETREVSKYDDDQMPYTFLWWLHKTRMEHSAIYQPYSRFNPAAAARQKSATELNHQIIEHIFHLQSPLAELETAQSEPTPDDLKRKEKEEEIIEKFIREEPQIKPPASDKLDMENKARRSAEDPNDLVSETLAYIYTEQMLFHKAIDTYKKLSLKFPEKKAYFADQIRELEKKIN